MVNKEAKQKDGFGLPSTDKRPKDNALELDAAIKDMVAKWNAYQESLIVKPKKVVEEVIEGPTEEAKAEAKKLDDLADKLAKEKADKKAKLQAELDALDD